MQLLSAPVLAFAALTLSLTSPARAQQPDTTHKFSGSGDFGFVNAAGNTQVTTINFGA